MIKEEYKKPTVEVIRLGKLWSILLDASLVEFGIDEYEEPTSGAWGDVEAS